MTDRYAHYYWLSHEGAPAPSPPWQSLSDAVYWERRTRSPYVDRQPPAPSWAEDLRRISRAVFAADRYTPRGQSFDRWTRHIRLSVPVDELGRWEDTAPYLTSMLSTVTGDIWDIQLRRLEEPHRPAVQSRLPLPAEDLADVSLFSGGLDSLGWVAQLAATPSPEPLFLITFEELNVWREQQHVYQCVDTGFKRSLRLLDHNQNVRGPGGGVRLERSTRSRGLLYAATAVHAAAAEQVRVVHIPENGQLAVNPPLSTGRTGSCSTRSVHPWTLHQLNRVIQDVAGDDVAVRVENPFVGHTKGEVCKAARDAPLPRHVLEATLSCGTPPRRKRGTSQLTHCGLCFPCLIRRSGLLAAFNGDRTHYAADPWDPTLSADRTRHWRALLRWLDSECTALDLMTAGPLPPDARPEQLLRVVENGREELRNLVSWATGGRRTAASQRRAATA